jgi:predicted GNAT family N-acyltransferase
MIQIADFRIEPATYQADLADLRTIRETVFVQEQNVPLEEEWDELDPVCVHVLARDQANSAIGTGRLIPPGLEAEVDGKPSPARIGRMAVLKEWRGRGVGAALLDALIEVARQRAWGEVILHAQVTAEPFYAQHGFTPYGERFMEAGIEHQSMLRVLPPPAGVERHALPPRPPSVTPQLLGNAEDTIAATVALLQEARRGVNLYSRDLEPVLYANPRVLEAFKQFAISGRGGVVRILLLEPATPLNNSHPLLALAQRLPTAFVFRSPSDPVDQNYPSAFLTTDHDGYWFRVLGSRWEGEWTPAGAARCKQIEDAFGRMWERARACTELRALGI